MLARGEKAIETRRGLPGEAEDTHSRYLEVAVKGILVGCLYLPNGNPAPGPKFDYKLRWFNRFIAHAAELLSSDLPMVLAGDYNVMPTDLDVYKPERWVDDALFRPAFGVGMHGCRPSREHQRIDCRPADPAARIMAPIASPRSAVVSIAGMSKCTDACEAAALPAPAPA